MVKVPHPIPYQGSKRKLAAAILAYLPEKIERLIEPFAGSAAVSIAALEQNRVKQVFLNDINEPLIRLWGAILHTPGQLAHDYQQLWAEQLTDRRAFYLKVRQDFNQQHCPEQFLYLLARCVKAAVRYNASGEFNQSADHRRKGMQPATMQKHIEQASMLLKGRATLQAIDYRSILQEVTSSDVIYLDPPYQGVSGKRDPRYIQGIDAGAFIDTLHELNQRNIPYLLSYDGTSGDKTYGQALPDALHLERVELHAGRSSQATLLGREDHTIEYLYLSPAIQEKRKAAKV